MASPLKPPPEPVTWSGENVSVGQILAALNDIRRQFAQAEAGEDDHPRPRNCVMTLIAVATDDTDERRARQVCAAIASHHPSLAILVRQHATGSGHIDATISTSAMGEAAEGKSQAGGPGQYEVVTIHIRGAAGQHVAALVDPLLVSGVPTYLWWLDTPPFGSWELKDTMSVADAVLVDTARFDRPHQSFLALADLPAHSHKRLGVADFQWARLAPWRESLAAFFAPHDRRKFMSGISEVGIDYVGDGRGNRIGAMLLAGWFGSALGWTLQRATGGTGGVISAQMLTPRGRVVDLAFRSVAKPSLSSGEVSAVRIAGAAAGTTFQIRMQRDPERSRRASPDIGPDEFRHLHHTGGEDDAGLELAHRKAAQHREMLHLNKESLHHVATGHAPGESMPRRPTVLVRERRGNSSLVLLTLIDIGGADTLRHVERVEAEEEATLLLRLLATGARDDVFTRSLMAGAELARSL